MSKSKPEYPVSYRFPEDTMQMVHMLQAKFGRLRKRDSQTGVVQFAISELHQQFFPNWWKDNEFRPDLGPIRDEKQASEEKLALAS